MVVSPSRRKILAKIDKSILVTFKTEWLIFSYLVLLYAGWNFTTHGSQDLYVTMITKQYHVGLDKKTIIIVVSNIGGIIGGIIMGQASELLGRRLTVVISIVLRRCILISIIFNRQKLACLYLFKCICIWII